MVRQEMEIELRPPLRRFAEDMERALRARDQQRGDRGWIQDSPDALLTRLEQELGELRMAIQGLNTGPRYLLEMRHAGIRKEAADVANFAMMIHDVCRDA